jgi:hypothetical protein
VVDFVWLVETVGEVRVSMMLRTTIEGQKLNEKKNETKESVIENGLEKKP